MIGLLKFNKYLLYVSKYPDKDLSNFYKSLNDAETIIYEKCIKKKLLHLWSSDISNGNNNMDYNLFRNVNVDILNKICYSIKNKKQAEFLLKYGYRVPSYYCKYDSLKSKYDKIYKNNFLLILFFIILILLVVCLINYKPVSAILFNQYELYPMSSYSMGSISFSSQSL